jgi:hypothetical protein
LDVINDPGLQRLMHGRVTSGEKAATFFQVLNTGFSPFWIQSRLNKLIRKDEVGTSISERLSRFYGDKFYVTCVTNET